MGPWAMSCSWRFFLKLAMENGWEPEGTKPPGTIQMINPNGDDPYPEIPDNWCGSYFYNDLQLVTEEDAKKYGRCIGAVFGI